MKRQQGLSLIELMIAILISSILLLGVLQLFSNTSDTDRTSSALSRVQESGRLALEIMGDDARRSGYQGCNSSANTTKVGALTFPAAAIDATVNDTITSISFRYATTTNTGTRFSANKDCNDIDVYLNNVTYSNCPSNGVARICKTINGGTASAILDHASIASISIGVPNAGLLAWKSAADVTTSNLADAQAVRLTLTISDSRNELSRSFTGTYELRNRL